MRISGFGVGAKESSTGTVGDTLAKTNVDVVREQLMRDLTEVGQRPQGRSEACAPSDQSLLLGHRFQRLPSLGDAGDKGPAPLGVQHRFAQRVTVVHGEEGFSDFLR